MAGAKLIKVATDGFVTVGIETAIILTFLGERDPVEGLFGCERKAGTEAMGVLLTIKGLKPQRRNKRVESLVQTMHGPATHPSEQGCRTQ